MEQDPAMVRTVGLFDLIQALRRRRRAVTALTLAEELGVSKRTIHRDIETLIALGAPIQGEAGVGYILRPGFMLPPLMLSEDELEALALGGLWVTQRADRALVKSAENALAKISAVLPEEMTPTLEAPPLLSAPTPTCGDEVIDPTLIRSAIRRRRKLRIIYTGEDGTRTDRVVWPIALVYFDATRLLAGWCEMRQGFRHFRTDRIGSVEATDEHYPGTRVALVKAWRSHDAISGRRNVPASTVVRN
jgi:predicted DNA-binding transcriptional regulator YafY